MPLPESTGDAIEDLNEVARRIRAGEEYTTEEYKQILSSLRTHRATAVETDSKTGKSKKVKGMTSEEIMSLFDKKE